MLVRERIVENGVELAQLEGCRIVVVADTDRVMPGTFVARWVRGTLTTFSLDTIPRYGDVLSDGSSRGLFLLPLLAACHHLWRTA